MTTKTTQSRKRWTIGCSVVLITIGLGSAVYMAIGNPIDPFDNEHFSQLAWQAADPQERAGMARDLVAHHLPPGMPMSRVQSLLGAGYFERQTEGPGDHPPVGTGILSYDLGNHSAYGMDDAFVWVHIDQKDNVLFAEVGGY